MQNNYINHIALVLDASSSMSGLSTSLIKVADEQIAHLARRSKELDQETRVTVYTFADRSNIKCHFYDKDVLRLPSMAGVYKAYGNTALVDATLKSIDDLSKTPELYGDHSFLVYVLTDGEENQSSNTAVNLKAKLSSLKDNWTVAVFVPSITGKSEAKRFGFPSDNIAVWDTSAKGMEEVGKVIRDTTNTYMANRTTGTRGYKNLFSMASNVTKDSVQTLPSLHPGQYRTYEATEKVKVSEFVEKTTGRPYKLGEAFYQLSKPEKIQPTKQVALLETKTKKLFTGTGARSILGLPDHEVRVGPNSYPDYQVFVQSTSVNRNLVPGTFVLLLS